MLYAYIRECASTLYLGWITSFPLVKYKTKIQIYQLLGNIYPKRKGMVCSRC